MTRQKDVDLLAALFLSESALCTPQEVAGLRMAVGGVRNLMKYQNARLDLSLFDVVLQELEEKETNG